MSGRRAKAQRRAWTSGGYQTEATPERQIAGRQRHEETYAARLAAGEHMWTVIVQHLASDRLLDAMHGSSPETPLLDVDTMLGPPMVICYVCEIPLTDASQRRTRCPGEPPMSAR